MNEIININRISISDRIKEYRRSRALTQGEFGRLLGVSP